MYTVSFEYPVNTQLLTVNATCKSIIDTEVSGLTLVFTNSDDVVVKVNFDQDMFEDIEAEACAMLNDMYYNPELDFNKNMRHH